MPTTGEFVTTTPLRAGAMAFDYIERFLVDDSRCWTRCKKRRPTRARTIGRQGGKLWGCGGLSGARGVELGTSGG
jgi:hypothetical protein